MAWTGIASILLPKGMTSHKTFNLPLDLNNTQNVFFKNEKDKIKLRQAINGNKFRGANFLFLRQNSTRYRYGYHLQGALPKIPGLDPGQKSSPQFFNKKKYIIYKFH